MCSAAPVQLLSCVFFSFCFLQRVPFGSLHIWCFMNDFRFLYCSSSFCTCTYFIFYTVLSSAVAAFYTVLMWVIFSTFTAPHCSLRNSWHMSKLLIIIAPHQGGRGRGRIKWCNPERLILSRNVPPLSVMSTAFSQISSHLTNNTLSSPILFLISSSSVLVSLHT